MEKINRIPASEVSGTVDNWGTHIEKYRTNIDPKLRAFAWQQFLKRVYNDWEIEDAKNVLREDLENYVDDIQDVSHLVLFSGDIDTACEELEKYIAGTFNLQDSIYTEFLPEKQNYVTSEGENARYYELIKKYAHFYDDTEKRINNVKIPFKPLEYHTHLLDIRAELSDRKRLETRQEKQIQFYEEALRQLEELNKNIDEEMNK